MMERYLTGQVRRDVAKKMVFVGGPRQVGKTTMAQALLTDDRGYLNWDVPEHREAILRRELPAAPLLVFDELHKYRSWRNYLKGLYDRPGRRSKILVMGSARLDLYRFGGDSLQGRYHYLRLHPLSFAELSTRGARVLDDLLALGGFPEPFLGGSQIDANRWSLEYRNRLLRDDVASLERVQDLGNLELLVLRLPELVGSLLSVNALREDLQLGHQTVESWLQILERLYAIFRISPFGSPKIRAIKKAQKHYHFDWSLVPAAPARFENLVASHLLKWVHFELDTKGRELELRYFRDEDGREVDFIVVERRRPILLVECKSSPGPVDRSLRYLKEKFPEADAWQLSATGEKDFMAPEGIRVCPAPVLLANLV
jgi:uncharacterized protein